jgi:hypothetical protein
MEKNTQNSERHETMPAECLHHMMRILNKNGIYLTFPSTKTGEEAFLLGLKSACKEFTPKEQKIVELVQEDGEYYCLTIRENENNETIKKKHFIGKDAAENVLKPFLEYIKKEEKITAIEEFITRMGEKIHPTLESLKKKKEEKVEAIKKQEYGTAATKRDEEKIIWNELIVILITLAKEEGIPKEDIKEYFGNCIA